MSKINMSPPLNRPSWSDTVNGHTYQSTYGAAVSVIAGDVGSLLALGWLLTNANPGLHFLSLAQFNPAADAQVAFDGAINVSSNILTSASGMFLPSDVGKVIIISGAGYTMPTYIYAHITTIASYTSPTQVVLALAAETSASAAPFVWGTDDSPAMQAALNAMVSGQDLVIPAGNYLFASAILRDFGSTPTGPQSIRIMGQGAGTVIYVCAKDPAGIRTSGSVDTLTLNNLANLKISNILFTGCPQTPFDNLHTIVLNYIFIAEIECDFYGIGGMPHANQGGCILAYGVDLRLKSNFRGTAGGDTVSCSGWYGFTDNGSEFVDWGYLNNQYLAKSLYAESVNSWIEILEPASTASAQAGFTGQSKVVFRNTRFDEDGGTCILVNAAAGSIRELEIDGVSMNAPGSFTGVRGDSTDPGISISGVLYAKVNGWIGYNTTLINDGIVLANCGTVHLSQLTLAQLSNRINAAATVGTLIIEDCTYTTLNSSARQTIVTQKGQVTPPIYTVATLPAASAANKGRRANVSDQLTSLPAFGAALTGGGTLLCPCWSTGAAWVAG